MSWSRLLARSLVAGWTTRDVATTHQTKAIPLSIVLLWHMLGTSLVSLGIQAHDIRDRRFMPVRRLEDRSLEPTY